MDTLEEDRLEAELDKARTVTYEGTDYSYQPQFEWATGDFDDNYPVLTLGYQQEAAERTADTPMTDLLEIDLKTDDPTVDFHNASRVTDEIQCTVATETGFDANGVPAHVVVQQLSMDIWKQIRLILDLNTVGSNGESPMVFNVAAPPSGPYRMDDTVRANFVFGANYLIVATRTEDSVASADTTVNTN